MTKDKLKGGGLEASLMSLLITQYKPIFRLVSFSCPSPESYEIITKLRRGRKEKESKKKKTQKMPPHAKQALPHCVRKSVKNLRM
jgi:hypothetical protein